MKEERDDKNHGRGGLRHFVLQFHFDFHETTYGPDHDLSRFETAHAAGAGGLAASEEIDNLKRMEDAGAPAVVLYSLFEEQLRQDRLELHLNMEQGTFSFPEALTYFPEPEEYHQQYVTGVRYRT